VVSGITIQNSNSISAVPSSKNPIRISSVVLDGNNTFHAGHEMKLAATAKK
jgi:hypothetical protein